MKGNTVLIVWNVMSSNGYEFSIRISICLGIFSFKAFFPTSLFSMSISMYVHIKAYKKLIKIIGCGSSAFQSRGMEDECNCTLTMAMPKNAAILLLLRL